MLLMRNVINKQETDSVSLGQLVPGDKATIVGFEVSHSESSDFIRRLFEVGFIEGTTIEVLHEAPFSRDPISIRIKEATYALRRSEVQLIQVKKFS
jgi:ferrous iron transport protein A